MLDRVSIFSNPGIVELLKTRFVPLAVDAWYHSRKKDAEGEFYRKVVTQERARRNLNRSTQGRYVFTADGRLLGFNNNRSLPRVQRLLNQALERFKPGDAVTVDAALHRQYDRSVREGTVVVNVNAKVLGGAEETDNKWRRIFAAAIGEDHLWIMKDEAAAIARGELPENVKRRLARFHFNDFTRGEPNMWRAEEIRKLELTLEGGRLRGRVHLETKSGDRGYVADVLGYVEAEGGKITRFDMVALGEFWGEGTYTKGAPKGRFPLAVAFRLADASKEAAKVPPQGSRWLPGYLRAR